MSETAMPHLPSAHLVREPVRVEVPVRAAKPGEAKRNPYMPWRSTLLTPQRVKELSKLRPGRVVFDTLMCWALIALGWAAVAVWGPGAIGWSAGWLVLIPAVMLIGTRYYGLFILGHDGMHRRLFENRKLNDWWTDVFMLAPIGMVNHVNDRNHLAHHRYLATDRDPDLHKHACFNKTNRSEYLAFLTGLASVIEVAKNLFWRWKHEPIEDEHEPLVEAAKDPHTLRDLAVIGTWQLSLIVGLTFVAAGMPRVWEMDVAGAAWALARGWWGYPVLWLLPVYAFAYLPNLVRAFLEHAHAEDDDKADEHRLMTYLSNPVERWFMSPMNMNYHVVHHLWPSIPYYNLPVADREIRVKPEAEGLVWRGSYARSLVAWWLALPIEECRASRQRKRHGG
jgi:fatty acid desaturase